jgi:methyl-accepting chemotaxis protein
VAGRDTDALDSLVRERLYPAIDPLTESIGAVLDTLIVEADTDVGIAQLAAENGAFWLSLLALVSIGLLLAAGTAVRVRATTPLARLTAATGETRLRPSRGADPLPWSS